MDRISLEGKTFNEILRAFGEFVEVTEDLNTKEVACIATSFQESARYLSDDSTYQDFSGDMHHGITVQFTWMIEVKKNDWNFSKEAAVVFRSNNYKIVSMNETDVSTYKILLIEN